MSITEKLAGNNKGPLAPKVLYTSPSVDLYEYLVQYTRTDDSAKERSSAEEPSLAKTCIPFKS